MLSASRLQTEELMPKTSIEWLIENLCVNLGFCLPTEAQAQLLEDTPSTAEEFATAVFSAEGIDPASEHRIYGQVVEFIEDAFRRSASRDA